LSQVGYSTTVAGFKPFSFISPLSASTTLIVVSSLLFLLSIPNNFFGILYFSIN